MKSLVNEKVENFFCAYPLKKYPAKEILVHSGDSPQGVMYLISGNVRQFDITSSGDEITINVFRPPAFFPMSWAINKTPNNYFFETINDVALHLCPAQDAVQFIRDNPDVEFDLLSRVYSGLDGMLVRMSLLMKGSAYARLILELIITAERFGTKNSLGYQLEISENDLATRAGLTRETVSREVQKLHQKNLIKIGHKKILIYDLQRLKDELAASQ